MTYQTFTITATSTAFPSTTVATASLSTDTGTSATDFITNTAAQTISGTLSANLVAGESVQVSFDGGTTWTNATTYTTGSSTWSTTTTLSGTNTFEARVTNSSGSSTAYTHSYELNTAAPSSVALSTSSVLTTATGVNTTVASLSSTDTDAVTYALVAGNGTNDAANADFTIAGTSLKSNAALAAGTYNIKVSATDAAGNVTYQNMTVIVSDVAQPRIVPVSVVLPTTVIVSKPVSVQNSVSETGSIAVPTAQLDAHAPDGITSVALVLTGNDRSISTFSDARTSASGFSIPVLAATPGSDPEIHVVQQIPLQSIFSVGDTRIVNFTVPSNTFSHNDPSAIVTLSAVMPNGQPLPNWLSFNAETGQFRGVVPSSSSGLLEVSVRAADNHGKQARVMVRIDLNKLSGQTDKSNKLNPTKLQRPADKTHNITVNVLKSGKTSLLSQMHGQDAFTWKVSRDHLIQQAREMALSKAQATLNA